MKPQSVVDKYTVKNKENIQYNKNYQESQAKDDRVIKPTLTIRAIYNTSTTQNKG